ncbi:hypothetical protein G7Y89_g14518 [Cudoniella acicularis]|uniref:PA14 domain-containing protein n=1 Tax=Cudoniella acicularis TaxID=354080 RepID=A0A8H4VVK8_9HELO|nr:hypothetical protein G7Y89_g14518 [Cudoniella acicularis]
MEALYARGFTSEHAAHPLSATEFESALVGTVAYPFAGGIFMAISSQAPPQTQPTAEPAWEFAPVNSNGAIVDCPPPSTLSPLGPIAYLHDLLNVSVGELETPLADILSARRNSPGKQQASFANLEIRIPRLDIIIENLEALGSNPGKAQGIFLNTKSETGSSNNLRATPQNSSPAIPTNPQVYETIKSCFTASNLPYSQALDVSRSLLSSLGTDRFDLMRHFRKYVTEFAVNAQKEPNDFQKHIWRYPVRFDIAMEYLHISSDEYHNLFAGSLDNKEFLESVLQLNTQLPTPAVISVSLLLESSGLSYPEFIELWKCKYVHIDCASGQGGRLSEFPPSEPYNTGELQISLGSSEEDPLFILRELFVFVRLWRILRHLDGPAISFNELASISTTLSLFRDGSINSDFVRQLAALIMLRDHFKIPLSQTLTPISSLSQETGATLLGLWQESKEKPTARNDATAFLLDHIEAYSRSQLGGSHREATFRKELDENLNVLSTLAGFNEADPWYAKPTSTLRFAEIVSKIYASRFTVGEISLIFRDEEHVRSDDPFYSPNVSEAALDPLTYPANEFSLWHLRKRLLHISLSEEHIADWTWKKITASLQELGYAPSVENDPLTSLGEHFFAEALERDGQRVSYESSIFTTDLPVSATTPSVWNSDRRAPFHYDADGPGQLWFRLPLREETVIENFANSRQFSDIEINALQNLYFAPRAALAPFATIFPNFDDAVRELVHEHSEHKRFKYFQRLFALFYRRCEVIADHLSEHVSSFTKTKTRYAAWSVLRRLFADENSPVGENWESESGAPPSEYTWEPHISGSAFASLLGVVGTGLLGEFRVDGKAGATTVWRQVTGDLTFFGRHENAFSTPVPTIIPSSDFILPSPGADSVNAINGFAVRKSDEEALGGGQSFKVSWTGSLLVEYSGEYTFFAGNPRPDDEIPDFEALRDCHRWLLTLKRGDKSWTLLNHQWDGQAALTNESAMLSLHRGVYHIEIYFEKLPLDLVNPHCEKTGFQVKYKGPDTGYIVSVVPLEKLFRESKTGTLDSDLSLCTSAAAFLDRHYTSSLRDIRRTYQRAFKGLLFTSQFNLSAERSHQGRLRGSELDYFLDNPASFLGSSYYRESLSSSTFLTHRAYFDFNLLPVTDNYDPTEDVSDQRAHPTPQRKAALFDWWERIFDYCKLRHWVRKATSQQCWGLFQEAKEPSSSAQQLLHYLVTDINFAPLIQTYFDSPGNYSIVPVDLSNEQWAIRSCYAGLWLHRLKKPRVSNGLEKARPWLWSADDPNFMIENDSGNQNLFSFFRETLSALGSQEEIQIVNDGLRIRARAALLEYLCDKNRVPLPFLKNTFAQTPLDLTDLLLLDVETGLRDQIARIDDTLDSIYRLVSRIRLGLELEITSTPKFAQVWDTKFKTFEVWTAQKRRQIYQENWIQWDDLHKAQKSEGFQILTNELRRNVLTIPKPGGLASWTGAHIPNSKTIDLQNLVLPSLSLGPADNAIDGVNLLTSPSHGGQKSLLSSVAVPTSTSGDGQGQIPLWMNAAIKMGVQFVRLAAASSPPLELHSQVSNNSGERETLLNIDEFYFWITPASWYNGEDVNQNASLGATPPAPSSLWDPDFTRSATDPTLQTLLAWTPESIVHLNWCRVHFGAFETPRRSEEGFHWTLLNSTPQLTFSGRVGDSLTFSVVNGPDSFSYDIPTDTAIPLLNSAANATTSTTSFPNPLTAYPFFIYFDAGAPLIPPSKFSTCVTIAGHLRSHGQFEASLKWYELAFNPLRRDNTWHSSSSDAQDTPPDKVQARAVLLGYLETLLQWANTLTQESSSAARQQASSIFNMMGKILGPRPKKFPVQAIDSSSMTVENFIPSAPALNPRLIELYDNLADARLHLSYKGSGECFGPEISFDKYQVNHSPYKRHPYRFLSLLPKALELTGYVRTLGNSLLQAFERGDAEYLASLQSTYDKQISTLSLEMKKNQFRSSDWEMQSLQTALNGALCRLNYYQNLIRNGLNSNETSFQVSTALAITLKQAAGASLATAESLTSVPDLFDGVAGAMGTPLTFSRLTGGSSLSSSFNIAANILSASGWDRRLEEWNQQVDTITLELLQLEQQKLAADRRKAVSQRDLNITQRQIEHAAEVQDFIRDKTTSLDLYMFLQQETAILYRQAYDLATQAALEAQRMFYYERRDTNRDFIPLSAWSNLREGLLAGEQLELALHTMQRAYVEMNYREQEVTKQISLNMQFPAAFLLLKTTGKCEIDIPEWMFDLDYPGQYMRRIRNVSLTIPCVIGPYTGIHCRLELLNSRIRVNSTLSPSVSRCRPDCSGQDCGYEIQLTSDPRFVQQFGAYESIATSSGQSDTGLFEINFNDERYLPFEFSGAVSRWRIELPAETNQFELNTLTDVVMTLNYTSRDGGQALRIAANEKAQRHLPGEGWSFFDVRYQFPDAWNMFHRSLKKRKHAGSEPTLQLQFNRNMFPFLNGHREISIVRIQLLIRAPSDAEIGDYIHVQYRASNAPALEFDCILASQYPGLYQGILDISFKVPRSSIGNPEGRDFGVFVFPHHGDFEEAYALVQYEYSDSAAKGKGATRTREYSARTSKKDGNRNRHWRRPLGREQWNDGIGGLDGEEVEASVDL